MCYFAELEMTSDKLLKKVLDINLFGAVRITKSLLPLIRKAKGRIVNVSSLLGNTVILNWIMLKIPSEYDQEMPQSQTNIYIFEAIL